MPKAAQPLSNHTVVIV